ncbi:MAG: dockerin type I domain-containing protein, partial [bacterium]
NLADQSGFPPPSITPASYVEATDSTVSDWRVDIDSGYYRITISQTGARKMFPDSYPWTTADWKFNSIYLDTWQDLFNPERKIKIIFHLLGYPKWLMAPEDTVPMGPLSGWLLGDTKLPVFESDTNLGLIRYSELITQFCNHFDSMGVDFAMTIMAEPNLKKHWTGTWEDANRYYEAFVNGVDASTGGTNIRVGGLVWAAGAQAGVASIDTIIAWASYWHDFCHAHNVRHDFICYHHYWHVPDRFDTVAIAFEGAFPGHEFWITEWNYKYRKLIQADEYEQWVAGMSGATGNLEFVQNAREHPSHPVMSFYRVIGRFRDYGLCHWRDSSNWDYTASGHAFKWLASFEDMELEIGNSSLSVDARASSGNDNIKALLWNHNSPTDTIHLTIPLDSLNSYGYEIWKMDDDSVVASLYYEINLDSLYLDSVVTYDPVIIYLPVPYPIERGYGGFEDFIREVVIDTNEIVYVSIREILCNKGDVNGDGEVNVLDVVMTVNIILELYEPTPEEACAADCTEDGEIDVLDVVCIVDLILGI